MVKKKNKYKRKGFPYKNTKGYLSLGVNTIGSTALIGSIPNISGTVAETGIKESYAKGMGNIGKTFPTMGKLVGTEMVFKSLGKLKKSTKKIKRRK
jgi:hypothetical protein